MGDKENMLIDDSELKNNVVLYLGDCLEVMTKIPSHSIDALITDPPFTMAGGISNGMSSNVDTQFFDHWWRAICNQLVRILKPDGEGFIWCDWKTAMSIDRGFRPTTQVRSWRVSQMLFHYREMPGMGQPFRSSVDMIAYVRGPKGKGGRIPNTTHNFISKYWYYGKHKYHPSEKDAEVIAKLIDWCSDPGMTIIDPFMGSGTTGVACIQTGRKFLGIEIEEDYYKIAKERILVCKSNAFDSYQTGMLFEEA